MFLAIILSRPVLPNTASVRDDTDTDCELNVTKILSLPIKTHNKLRHETLSHMVLQ